MTLESLMSYMKDDINGYFYEVMKGKNNKKYQLKLSSPDGWVIEIAGTKPVKIPINKARQVFEGLEFDIDKIKSLIFTNISIMVVYYNMRQNDAEDMLGKSTVDDMIKSQEGFQRRLKQLVSRVTNKTSLTLIKGN